MAPGSRVCACSAGGGVAAALLLRLLFGTAGNLGATVPGAGVNEWQALVIEVLLTAGLVNTILGTASGARNIGTNGAIAVGGYIALAGLWAAPISGATMNGPATWLLTSCWLVADDLDRPGRPVHRRRHRKRIPRT